MRALATQPNSHGLTRNQVAAVLAGLPLRANPKPQQRNGIILKDGKYTLRLTPQGLSSSSSDPTAEVTIDTKKPLITESKVTTIDDINNGGESPESFYTIRTIANDGTAGQTSGLDTSSLKMKFKNATFESEGTASVENDGAISYRVKYITAPKSSKKLKFQVQIQDLAGNVSDPFDAQFYATVTEGLVFSGGLDSGASTAYRSLFASGPFKFKLKDDYVFYVKSGIIGQAQYRYYTMDPTGFFVNGKRDVFIVDTKNGQDYFKTTINYSGLKTVHDFEWNGHNYDKKDSHGQPLYPPTGAYTISAYRGDTFNQLRDRVKDLRPSWLEYPTIARIEIDRDSFKVSDKPCLKLDEWNSSSVLPAPQDDGQAFHILERHLIEKANSPKPEQMFYTYDLPNFLIPLASVAPTRADFKKDPQRGYAITHRLKTTSQYIDTLKIAGAVWAHAVPDPLDNARNRYMPTVLKNGKVLWVGATRFTPNQALMTTAYPFVNNIKYDDTGNTIIGQTEYEKSIGK